MCNNPTHTPDTDTDTDTGPREGVGVGGVVGGVVDQALLLDQLQFMTQIWIAVIAIRWTYSELEDFVGTGQSFYLYSKQKI